MKTKMKAKELYKTSNKANKRKSRKIALREYRRLKKSLKRIAKRGQYYTRFNFSIWGQTGWEHLLAVRFFKIKHKDFNVKIAPEKHNVKDSFLDCDRVYVTIKFDQKQ